MTMYRFRQQRGSFLLESLIGLVLMAIISMGAVAVTTRAQVAQADAFTRQHVVNQLRLLLLKNKFNGANLCPPPPVLKVSTPDGVLHDVTVGNCTPVSATVRGATVTGVQLPLSLSVDMDDNGVYETQVGGVLAQ